MTRDEPLIDLGMAQSESNGSNGGPLVWLNNWRARRQWGLAVIVALLTVVVTGVAEPSFKSVVGVLPDGTLYELLIPGGIEVGNVEAISAVPVWADGPQAGAALGVPRFTRSEGQGPFTRTTVEGTEEFGRLFVPAGTWTMVVDLYDYSLGREPELETIVGRDWGGLPVIDLPSSVRWPDPGELPQELAVAYRHFRVVRGCTDIGKCSPDGQVMVVATGGLDADLSSIRVRVR